MIISEERSDEGLRLFNGNVCGALRAFSSGGKKRVIESTKKEEYKIRRLTPKECFRLMGFSDIDFGKAQDAGISNSQLYKQAGNSIVVDVLYYIYKELYEAMPYLFEDLKVASFFSGIGAFEKALDRLYDENDKNDYGEHDTKSEPVFMFNPDVIVYDDYNSNIRNDQSTMGTLTTNIGSSTLRNATKLIEKFDR